MNNDLKERIQDAFSECYALDELARLYFDIRLECEKQLEYMSRISKVNAFNRFIDTMPSADVEEVRHGKWERRLVEENGVAEMKSVCSECGKTNKRYEPPYCPNCGAKMDNEQE